MIEDRATNNLVIEADANRLEALHKLYIDFCWTPIVEFVPPSHENASNKDVLLAAIRKLNKMKGFRESDTQLNEDAIMARITNSRAKAITFYREIYPAPQSGNGSSQTGVEPKYHAIGSEEEWEGHVEFVASVTATLFVGLQHLYLYVDNDKVQAEQFDNFFGPGWAKQENRLNLNDFFTLLNVTLFHEAGEWWIKDVWGAALDEQRRQQIDEQRGGDKMQALRDIVASWKDDFTPLKEAPDKFFEDAEPPPTKAQLYQQGIERMTELHTQLQKTVKGLGIGFLYDKERDPAEFYQYVMELSGRQRPELLEFTHKDDAEEKGIKSDGSKASVIATLFKAADFLQLLSTEYYATVDFTTFDGKEIKNKCKGPVALYLEFLLYRIGGALRSGWYELKDVMTTTEFIENFVAHYAFRDEVAKLIYLATGQRINFKKYIEILLEEEKRLKAEERHKEIEE